jgi:hypothetical protein
MPSPPAEERGRRGGLGCFCWRNRASFRLPSDGRERKNRGVRQALRILCLEQIHSRRYSANVDLNERNERFKTKNKQYENEQYDE